MPAPSMASTMDANPPAAERGVRASFRFYEELNDFLAPSRRRCTVDCDCARAATAKHMIEALGVPHTEVELILVNGESVGFGHLLREGDRVAVYPKFEALDITPLLKVRARPLRVLRFVADAHLGGLAHKLRLAGFDTLYDNHAHDHEIERLAHEEHRIVLTRDRELLKRRGITHGVYVRPLQVGAQLQQVFERLDLARSARPFTRCLRCNGLLRPARDDEVARAPQDVRARHRHFAACDGCGGLYWEGSHWRRMRAEVDALLAPPAPA